MKKYWESLRPFEKRVVAGVTTGLFVVFNLWFVLPHFSDLARMKNRMEDAQRLLRLRETAIAQKPMYEQEIKKLQSEGLDVPAADQALQFQRTVSDEEMRVGVNPISTGRIITSTNEFFLKQTQTINVQSGEQPLVDFLFNLGRTGSSIAISWVIVNDLSKQFSCQNVNEFCPYREISSGEHSVQRRARSSRSQRSERSSEGARWPRSTRSSAARTAASSKRSGSAG